MVIGDPSMFALFEHDYRVVVNDFAFQQSLPSARTDSRAVFAFQITSPTCAFCITRRLFCIAHSIHEQKMGSPEKHCKIDPRTRHLLYEGICDTVPRTKISFARSLVVKMGIIVCPRASAGVLGLITFRESRIIWFALTS